MEKWARTVFIKQSAVEMLLILEVSFYYIELSLFILLSHPHPIEIYFEDDFWMPK